MLKIDLKDCGKTQYICSQKCFGHERLHDFHVNCSGSLVAFADFKLYLVANFGTRIAFDIAGVDKDILFLSFHVDEPVSSEIEPSSYFAFH